MAISALKPTANILTKKKRKGLPQSSMTNITPSAAPKVNPLFPNKPIGNIVTNPPPTPAPAQPTVTPYVQKFKDVAFNPDKSVKYGPYNLTKVQYENYRAAKAGEIPFEQRTPLTNQILSEEQRDIQMTELEKKTTEEQKAAEVKQAWQMETGRLPQPPTAEELAGLGNVPPQQADMNEININQADLFQIAIKSLPSIAGAAGVGLSVGGPIGAAGAAVATAAANLYFAYAQISDSQKADVKIARAITNNAAKNLLVAKNYANAGVPASEVIQLANDSISTMLQQEANLKEKSKTIYGQDLSKALKDLEIVQGQISQARYTLMEIREALMNPNPDKMMDVSNINYSMSEEAI